MCFSKKKLAYSLKDCNILLTTISLINNNNRGVPMKRFILFSALIVAFLITGCDQKEDNQLVEPQAKVTAPITNPNWIALPASTNPTLQKKTKTGKWISGDEESLVEINTGYPTWSPYYWVSITANARFQRNSFNGKKFVTMEIDDNGGVADFSPSGKFYKPVIYNLTIQGIDLSGISPKNVKFVYMADDGSYYEAENDGIVVDKHAGKLQVINAKLPHFSRYGFTN